MEPPQPFIAFERGPADPGGAPGRTGGVDAWPDPSRHPRISRTEPIGRPGPASKGGGPASVLPGTRLRVATDGLGDDAPHLWVPGSLAAAGAAEGEAIDRFRAGECSLLKAVTTGPQMCGHGAHPERPRPTRNIQERLAKARVRTFSPAVHGLRGAVPEDA